MFSAVLAASLLFSAAALRFLPAPFVWAALGVGGAFLYGTFKFDERRRVVCFNIAMICLIFAGFETYYWWRTASSVQLQDETLDSEGSNMRNIRDDVLGYAPKPGVTVTWKRFFGDSLIFNVRYTIDSHGWRITPSAEVESPECVLFFGDSFTFGAGVNDAETFPYIVGVLAARQSKVYNFGYSGYGPNQTLAALKGGIVSVAGCQPSHAFFLAIDEHARRVSRPLNRPQHPPRYVRENGVLTYVGGFESDEPGISGAINRQLRKSYIARTVVFPALDAAINDSDIDLMVEVLSASKDVLEHLTPRCEFRVLYWNTSSTSDKIVSRLESRQLQVVPVSNILPDFADNRAKYELSPNDHHPNALAHRLIGEFVYFNVLRGVGRRPGR